MREICRHRQRPFLLFLVFILFLGLEVFDFIYVIRVKCEEYEVKCEEYEVKCEEYEVLSTGKLSLKLTLL